MDIEEPTPNPERTPYAMLGGETTVRALVDRFYDLMDEDPDYYGIRKLHPASLSGSREKLYKFLSGWLGGPPLYVEEFGHPRLRARHLHVEIGLAERDQWMACMVRAMADVGLDTALRERLEASFMNTADWMRNREG
jgi:hemoglobin